jgi:CHAT domain-containing protein
LVPTLTRKIIFLWRKVTGFLCAFLSSFRMGTLIKKGMGRKTKLVSFLLIVSFWGILLSIPSVKAADTNHASITQFMEAYRQGNDRLAWHLAQRITIDSLPDSTQQLLLQHQMKILQRQKVGADSIIRYGYRLSSLCRELKLEGTEAYAGIQFQVAQQLYYKSQMDSALNCLHEAYQHFSPTISARIYRNYYNFYGVMYSAKGEANIAYDFLTKAYDYALKMEGIPQASFLAMKHNMATLARKAGKFEEARKLYHDIEDQAEILPNYQKNSFDQLTLFRGIAWLYSEQKKYDSALSYVHKALSCYDPSRGELPLNYLKALQDQAKYLREKGDLMQALEKNQVLASQLMKFQGGSAKRVKSTVYTEQALCHLLLSNWEESLVLLDSAYLHYEDWFGDSKKNEKQSTFDYGQLAYIYWYRGKAYEQAYAQSGEDQYLKDARKMYIVAVDQVQRLRRSIYQHNDKASLIEGYYPLYEEALNCIYNEWQKDHKASSLYAAFKIIEANHSSILKDHKQLQLSKSQQFRRNEDSLLTLRSTLINSSLPETEKKDSLRALNVALRLINSNYVKSTLNEQERAGQLLPSLQAALATHQTTYLSYFMGEKWLYTAVISADSLMLKRVSKSAIQGPMQATFDALHRNKSRYMAFNARKASAQLYKELIEPYLPIIKEGKELLISPSGLLTYIPTEILIDEEGDFMIKNHTIYYALSAQEWLRSLQKDSILHQQRILAMAPFATLPTNTLANQASDSKDQLVLREGLQRLPYSLEEVGEVGKTFFIGEKATKDYFKKNASAFNIVHLATHARVNNTQPELSHIIFYPGLSDKSKLFAHEIATLSLPNAHIIALSACQTGNGQWRKGEGVMSLARAFAYAGASNILMTQWVAEDEVTAYIFKRFYMYVRQGIGKADALRQAKLDLIKDPAYKHMSINPTYWANIQLSGNNKYINPQKFPYTLLAGGFIILLSLLLGYLKFR